MAPSISSLEEFKDKNLFEKLQDMWYERSGTSEILALKESVNEASLEFDQASAKVTFARRHLDESLRDWEKTSGQHLQLLQRRESWTPEDAQSFANLVGNEITTRTSLEQAREDLATAEETLSRRQLEYMNRMRRRYHEEQIWQDQWRVLGTYGTWSLIVLNTENARMKAIEELIRDNSVRIAEATSQSASTTNETTANAAGRSQVDNESLALVNDGEIEFQDELLREEAATAAVEERLEKVVELEQLKEGASLKDRLQFQSRKLRFRAIENWQTLQKKSKSILNTVKSKTQEVVTAVPGLDEMPKSPSEVHVPSAIVGASVTGVAILVLMAIISPRYR
ncbi:MAG: hypothetical protein SGARI_001912 [Bacillariaceae sp.]